MLGVPGELGWFCCGRGVTAGAIFSHIGSHLTGDWRAVEKCLQEGISPDSQNSEGDSPLQLSAANGFLQTVNLLLNAGASIDLRNNYGWTPLMLAARHGHTSSVAFLLKMKAKVNVYNKLGLSPIVAAAWSGNLATLKLLVDAGALLDQMPLLNHSNECDLSPVMAACLLGHADVLNFLLMEGVLVDQVSPITGLSPLMLAACGGHKEITSILINQGTCVYKKDVCGKSALDLAITCCREEVVEFLENLILHYSLSDADIFQAIRSGDILKLKSCIKEDPYSVNIIGSQDNITPLMLASMLGYKDMVNLLVYNGADLNAQDPENGWTALMYAVFHSRADTVQLLLELGSSVDVCAANGCTTLDLARHTDVSNACVIDILTSKSSTVNLLSFEASSSSPSHSIDQQKLHGSEQLSPKKSDSQIGLKNWIGGVAQQLQTKMLTRLSSRQSERLSTTETLSADEIMSSDVFTEPTSPLEEPNIELCPSILLAPNKHLAKELREHKVEVITPLLPPISYSYGMNLPSRKSSSDKSTKPCRNSLQIPNLLRKFTTCTTNNEFVSPNKYEMKIDIPIECTQGDESCSTSLVSGDIEEHTMNSQIPAEFQEIPGIDNENDSKCSEGDLIADLLEKESLHKYVEKFREQEVDLKTLQHLTKDDLKEMGIQSSGSQNKLLEVINNLQHME